MARDRSIAPSFRNDVDGAIERAIERASGAGE